MKVALGGTRAGMPERPAGDAVADFGSTLMAAENTRREVCKALLRDFERQVNELQSLINPIRDADSRGSFKEGLVLWNRAFDILMNISLTLDLLDDCLRKMGPDGQPLLNDAERALLGRLMDRAREAAKAGELPIPDELYFKAKQGDPEAIRQLRQILQNVGEGVGKGAEIAAKIILGILGILGSAARRRAF
jgi:hypothetical protein